MITTAALSQLRDAISEGETPIADAVFEKLGITSPDDVLQDVDATLQSFGVNVSTVIDSVQGLVGTLPAGTSQFGDKVIEILNHLGTEGSELGSQLNDLLDSPEVQAIAEQVEAIVAEAKSDAAALRDQWHGLLGSLGTNGRPVHDAAVALIDSYSPQGGPLRGQIIALLQSDELNSVRAAIETRLDSYGVDIGNLQAAIDNFTARLAAGETPVRDWIVSVLSSADPAAISAQLTAEGESLGSNIDTLIDSISNDATTIGAAVDNLVNDLTGGTTSIGQLVDDILTRIDTDGTSDVGSLVDGILGDVDAFLANLFPGNDLLDSLLF